MRFEEDLRDSIARSGTLLARYEVGAVSRELVGYYHSASVSVFDRVVGSGGRGELLESGLLWREAVEQLVADQLEWARRTDSVPCGAEALRACLGAPGGRVVA